MLTSILITVILVAAVGFAARGGGGGLITRTPYGNRHNDASGARRRHLD